MSIDFSISVGVMVCALICGALSFIFSKIFK